MNVPKIKRVDGDNSGEVFPGVKILLVLVSGFIPDTSTSQSITNILDISWISYITFSL